MGYDNAMVFHGVTRPMVAHLSVITVVCSCIEKTVFRPASLLSLLDKSKTDAGTIKINRDNKDLDLLMQFKDL